MTNFDTRDIMTSEELHEAAMQLDAPAEDNMGRIFHAWNINGTFVDVIRTVDDNADSVWRVTAHVGLGEIKDCIFRDSVEEFCARFLPSSTEDWIRQHEREYRLAKREREYRLADMFDRRMNFEPDL